MRRFSALRVIVRPVGYLTFVLAVGALSASALILGERHELGFFSGRLARTIRRYPEVTRPGVVVAWGVWAVLLVLAVSPLSSTHWDEAGLAAAAALVIGYRLVAGHRAGR
jgi:hypothetical protein